jgi:hypothetical protein
MHIISVSPSDWIEKPGRMKLCTFPINGVQLGQHLSNPSIHSHPWHRQHDVVRRLHGSEAVLATTAL